MQNQFGRMKSGKSSSNTNMQLSRRTTEWDSEEQSRTFFLQVFAIAEKLSPKSWLASGVKVDDLYKRLPRSLQNIWNRHFPSNAVGCTRFNKWAKEYGSPMGLGMTNECKRIVATRMVEDKRRKPLRREETVSTYAAFMRTYCTNSVIETKRVRQSNKFKLRHLFNPYVPSGKAPEDYSVKETAQLVNDYCLFRGGDFVSICLLDRYVGCTKKNSILWHSHYNFGRAVFWKNIMWQMTTSEKNQRIELTGKETGSWKNKCWYAPTVEAGVRVFTDEDKATILEHKRQKSLLNLLIYQMRYIWKTKNVLAAEVIKELNLDETSDLSVLTNLSRGELELFDDRGVMFVIDMGAPRFPTVEENNNDEDS